MTQEQRTRMLHLTLEAEGLLTLLGERADQTPPEVIDLLRDKITELASLMPERPKPESEPESVQPATVEESVFEEDVVAEDAPACDTQFVPEGESGFESEFGSEPETESILSAKGLTVADNATALAAADMRNALTLNDRFRFRRALFNNSNDELNEALEAINLMSNAEEARQYFMEDLCWNPDDEDVKEFMRLVEAHFNN